MLNHTSMANDTSWDFDPFAAPIEFKYHDIAIGGTMMRCTIEVPVGQIISFGSDREFNDFVKARMSAYLAEHILSNRLVEFTRMQDSKTGITKVNARCYLAPDGQIKILRTHYNV